MRSSYISVLMFLFLLCSVYAINQDGFELPPVNIDSGNSNPSTSPSSSQGSFMPQMPADFANILAAGMVGITIGILLAALAYMIGNFFGFPQMIGWSKNQLWESIYTMVLISTVLIFSVAIHLFPLGVPEALATTNQISFPLKAATSIDNVIKGSISTSDLPADLKKELETSGFITTENMGIQRAFFMTYSYNLLLNLLYNLVTPEITLGPKVLATNSVSGGSKLTAGVGGFFKGNLLSGFKKLMSFSGTISNYILTLLMALYVQISLLIFISGGSLFLFMFGVIFRCIPFTRKMGSTLIALFITLYFIYPAFVLFIFSDGMYGKMAKEFAGVYVDNQWFEDLEGIDPNGLIIERPYGLTVIEDKNFEKGKMYLMFNSVIFPEYNYTVTVTGTSYICKGNATGGQTVKCDLSGSIPSNYNLIDPNDFNFKESLADFEILKFNEKYKPVNYDIVLSYAPYKNSENPSDKKIINYYPFNENMEVSKPLSFPIYYSSSCKSEVCHQYTTQLSSHLENYVSSGVRVFLLSDILDDLSEGKTEHKVDDLVIALTKGGISTFAGFGNVKMGVLVAQILYKNDITAFFYDEMTCDPYITIVSSDYFQKSQVREPTPSEKSTEYLDSFIRYLYNISATQDKLLIQKENLENELEADMESYRIPVLTELLTYYSESDYYSCSNSLGIYNSGKITSFVSSVIGGTGWRWKEMHMTVILAPIVYVFISFIYTIIFCVTFFKSLSESIGGDSSLLGLGKLL